MPQTVLLRWMAIGCLLGLVPPAAAAPADGIRMFLEGLDAGAAPVVAGHRLQAPALVSAVYRARNHAPLWNRGAPLAGEAEGLLAAIDESEAHGFAPERYHRSALAGLAGARDESAIVARDLLSTDAFVNQAMHRGQGAVSPPNLDADWQLPQAEVDAVALLADTAAGQRDVPAALAALWPVDGEYKKLVERRAEILSSGEVSTIVVPTGPLLKPGQSSERVVLLKERLMGPGDYTPLYDDELKAEVISYQRAAGLEADGIVGANTLEVLNTTRVSWIDRIDANLERWRWLPRQTPGTYIRVNIAAYTLRAFRDGEETLGMNVIVGQPYRRTPVFTETVKYMVFNPSWNVPYSIATKDKLPLLKANAAAEAAKGYEARPNGSDQFVSVERIDWSAVTARNFNYLLRQKPGPMNALGRLKIMLPNPYAIYLHDTPSRELFAREERSFSSGCIRLQNPAALAEWLLAGDGHPDVARIESMLASGQTQTVNMKTPVPTYIVYFTAFTLDDEVVFRRDIYERDRVIVDALRGQTI